MTNFELCNVTKAFCLNQNEFFSKFQSSFVFNYSNDQISKVPVLIEGNNFYTDWYKEAAIAGAFLAIGKSVNSI